MSRCQTREFERLARTGPRSSARGGRSDDAPRVRLLEAELIVVCLAYLMAGVPVGGLVLAGRMSPLYRVPRADLCRWWSWMALVIAAWLLARTFTS